MIFILFNKKKRIKENFKYGYNSKSSFLCVCVIKNSRKTIKKRRLND